MKVPKLFSRVLNRGEKLDPSMRQALILAHVSGEASRGTSGDEQNWKELLATNYEMLHDVPVEELLTDEMYFKTIYQDPSTQEFKVTKWDINYDMASLRLINSQVNRASFISPQEALIIKIKLRNIMRRIKLQSRPDQYSLGFVNFLKAIEINTLFLLNDAIEGRKARLLKTSPKVTTLNVEGQGASSK